MENARIIKVNGKEYRVNVPDNLLPKKKEKVINKKSSGLRKKLATGALILAIGSGAVFGAHALFNKPAPVEEAPPIVSQSQVVSQPEVQLKESLRFEPNTKEATIDNAVFLIEEAARTGKELDAKDAVFTYIVANANELKPSFMGQLFGEKKDQEYTYTQLVDSYLRTGMISVENTAISKNDDLALNAEDIFANKEDYEYIKNIRTLSMKFHNSTDESEKAKIAEELNKLAFDLSTYEAYDISSSAGVLSMLSLDGMHIITNTSDKNVILPDDVRDEIFGNGDYGCRTEATFTTNDGQVLQTQYSYRVNDLKLDSVKAKLDNAVLSESEVTILDDIIKEVKERTNGIEKADIDMAAEINKIMEARRTIPYANEETPGVPKKGYTPITPDDKKGVVDGKDVVITKGQQEGTKDEKTKEEAEKELEDKVASAQADADRGAADGKADGEIGANKRSTGGKSEAYTNAYNASYDAYKAIYDAQNSKEEDTVIKEETIKTKQSDSSSSIPESSSNESSSSTNESSVSSSSSEDNVVSEEFIPLDGLTPEQLQELKDAAVGEEPIYTENSMTK